MRKKAFSNFPKKRPAIRISGVVRAMNLARRSLAAGIPADEADHFCQWVSHTVTQVEQACHANRMKPEQLPAPTLRAYRYLKALDLKHLPLSNYPDRIQPTRPVKDHTRRLRVSNLVTICQGFQKELAILAEEPHQKVGRTIMVEARLVKLLERIHDSADEVDQVCRLAGARPAELPGPSRRAYQWLRFLGGEEPGAESEPGSSTQSLHQHLSALRKVNELLHPDGVKQAKPSRELSLGRLDRPVHFQFYNLPALFRVKVTVDSFEVVASEGFINAPDEVLADLLRAALFRKTKNHDVEEGLRKIRRFADSKTYTNLVLNLELKSPTGELTARGRRYDLEVIFERINAQYFQNQLPRPGLTWNQTLTWRKLGHYQPATDTIMVSISLDHPDVPGYVVDFVMYHEMLHKKFGIQEINGRHYAHTPQFRAAEREFSQYAEAQEFMRQIGEKPA